MSAANLNFSYGSISFTGEGDENWLSTQLDKVLAVAATLGQPTAFEKNSSEPPAPQNTAGNGSDATSITLAAHIKAKGGDANQVKRFLATSDWLRLRGSTRQSTSAVTKALSDGQQKRLSNPADCLNKNVAKGHCEKIGDEFFITPDGLKALGYS